MFGTVKNLQSDKGFGFIIATDSKDEYFFHHSACTGFRFDTLRPGSRVKFTPTQGAKGPRAESVELLD